jgi:hypothetical protein
MTRKELTWKIAHLNWLLDNAEDELAKNPSWEGGPLTVQGLKNLIAHYQDKLKET